MSYKAKKNAVSLRIATGYGHQNAEGENLTQINELMKQTQKLICSGRT